jgi:hypothetical protein
MNAMAPNFTDSANWVDDELPTLDGLSDSGGGRPSFLQEVALLAAILVGVILLVGAILLQTAYHAFLLLGIWFGLPSLFLAKAVGRRATAGVKRARRLSSAHSDRSRQGVGFTFDELALIYKSLQAARTLALPQQDELLEDTLEVVDRSLSRLAH